MVYKFLTTAFLLFNFVLSLTSWHIINEHIAKKPIISVSLVDLIYRDIIVYVLLLCLSASGAVVHTLMQDSFSLAYEPALIYSIAINVCVSAICISLTFSAGFRLVSIIKNLEAAGTY